MRIRNLQIHAGATRPVSFLRECFSLDTVACRRHPEETGPALVKPPFNGDLGQRIQAEICQRCWQDWLTHQTVLMNHYGLDPRDRKAKDFLYGQLRAVLFDEGERADVDTSKKGTIDW